MCMVYKVPPLGVIVIMCDAITLWLVIVENGVRTIFTLVVSSMAMLFIYLRQYAELNGLLVKANQCRLSVKKCCAQSQQTMSRLVTFVRVHSYVTVKIVVENRRVLSCVILESVVLYVCLNIYCIMYYLYKDNQDLWDRFIMVLTAVVYVLVVIPLGFLAAQVSHRIHKADKHMSNCQATGTIGPGRLRLKLKYMLYYEIICSNNKLGLSAGSLGTMTKYFVFNVFIRQFFYLSFTGSFIIQFYSEIVRNSPI